MNRAHLARTYSFTYDRFMWYPFKPSAPFRGAYIRRVVWLRPDPTIRLIELEKELDAIRLQLGIGK